MTEYDQFWMWFRANETQLFESADQLAEGEEPAVWEQFLGELRALHPSLSCLVGSIGAEGRRGLIISAGGERKAIPSVAQIFNAAPRLPRWVVKRYRPRFDGQWQLSYEGTVVDLDDVEFVLFTRNERPSLILFVRGYAPGGDDTDFYRQAIPIAVDRVLGEQDSMWLEEIKLCTWDSTAPGERHPLHMLAIAFDQMKATMVATPV